MAGVSRTSPGAAQGFALLDDLERQAKDLKKRISRALFNAGQN